MKNLKTVDLESGLYLVATPIGNLRDISLRALDTLAEADYIVCEDTRVTGKLLNAYDLKKKMISYNDHSASKQRKAILSSLANGDAIALVSDAGTPLVSDPGYKLVRDCLDLGLMVTVVPGANAALSALQISGLPSDKFSFIGFLPPKTTARKKTLSTWKGVQGCLLIYETAPRLLASLKDMQAILGNRQAAVIREITKRFEEAQRGSLSDLIQHYEDEDQPKGEIVIAVEAAAEEAATEEELEKKLQQALKTMHVKEAASFVADATGAPKKMLYNMALKILK